jgi:serine/threonine-protein kinase
MNRLTSDAAGSANMNPLWTPDGRYIIFAGKGGIYWTLANGGETPHRFTESQTLQLPYSITRNGAWLALMQQAVGSGISVWTMPIRFSGTGLVGGKPVPFPQTSSDARYPALSPDGSWLAYTSDESGTYEVYVRAFPNPGGKWQISNGGGAYPVWSQDGRELLFRSLDSRFMVVNYTRQGDSFVASKPRL